jgi:hypothetical protein
MFPEGHFLADSLYSSNSFSIFSLFAKISNYAFSNSSFVGGLLLSQMNGSGSIIFICFSMPVNV